MFQIAVLWILFGIPLHAYSLPSENTSVEIIRSTSGTSGEVQKGKFILDAAKDRFEFPRDNTIVVYFEGKASDGEHALRVRWKNPEGDVVLASPEITIEAVNGELNSYWYLGLASNRKNGTWTCEIDIDGLFAGAHSSEVVFPEPPPTPVVEVVQYPSLEELDRTVSQSLVRVHKRSNSGRRIDTSSGFVIAPDAVMTAFQSIDAAASLEIEFSDGTRVVTDKIISCDRLHDWAIVNVETWDLSPLEFGDPAAVLEGERLMVFTTEPGKGRFMGGIDITGQKVVPGFGRRILLDPEPLHIDAGGPLLDYYGKVVGIIGGSVLPGLLGDHRRQFDLDMTIAEPDLFRIQATPMEGIPSNKTSAAKTMRQYREAGVLTPPLSEIPELVYAAITSEMTVESILRGKRTFSREDPLLVVYTEWMKKGDIEKGSFSVRIYDLGNRLLYKGKETEIQLSSSESKSYGISMKPEGFKAGRYRIDVLWNGTPAWRTGITIKD